MRHSFMPILIHVKMRLSHLFRELHDWILQYMCNSNNETHFLSATVIEKKKHRLYVHYWHFGGWFVTTVGVKMAGHTFFYTGTSI